MATACNYVYKFVSCCDGTEIYFCSFIGIDSGGAQINGTYQWIFNDELVGNGGSLIPNQCYQVTTVSNKPPVVTPTPPLFIIPLTGNSAIPYLRAGVSCGKDACADCPAISYIFEPCCGGEPLYFNVKESIEAYSGTYGVVIPNPSNPTQIDEIGCYTITPLPQQNPSFPYLDSENIGSPLRCQDPLCELLCLPCRCVRFRFLPAQPNPTGVSIVTCDAISTTHEVPANGEWSEPVCLRSYQLPTQNFQAQELGECQSFLIDNEFSSICPTKYKLINCSNEDDFVFVTNNLSVQFSLNQVIFWNEKCWYIEEADIYQELITIEFTETYANCASCSEKITVNYQLVNCADDTIIIYTSTDLSTYVDSNAILQLVEYPEECWYLISLNTGIPSDTTVTVENEFEDCPTCLGPRYLLSDCTRQLPDFVTNTDLSQQVGSVIVIDSCPETCWEVQETDISVVNGPINPVGQFEDCPECLTNLLTVKCFEFSLSGEYSEANVTVWLPDGTEQSIDLNDKTQSSIKGCYLTWISKEGIVTKEFGLCVDNECPKPPKPKRKVTPGYDTPACTPEYYEKVECTFSEWMYKDVLEKRYGISNCCPEELMKWEIKHEMLMLDSLVNPDYNCLPQVDCGCTQPTTCNCSCNSGN